jgi:hypothetical protein
MNFFNEYGLLVAVALPVVAIVGLQVFLFMTGERGAGLRPGTSRYPSIDIAKVAEAAPKQTMSETPTIVITVASSNDEEERIAA